MKNRMRSFYTFHGSWFEIFDKLTVVFNSQSLQKFAIWESRSGNGENLLVLYGSELENGLQNKYCLKEITEPEFDTGFNTKVRSLRFMGMVNAIRE